MSATFTISDDDVEHPDACPACRATDPSLITSVAVQTDAGRLPFFDTSVCTSCGLVYRSARPDNDWYARNQVMQVPDKARMQLIADDSYARYSALCDALEARGVAAGKVLDIGAGLGAGLAAFRDRGWDVIGLEPEPYKNEFSDELNVNVVQGTIEENDLPQAEFDLVVFSHVLEHLREPVDALIAVRQFLRPGGLIYGEVPDVKDYASWRDAFYLEHLNNYSDVTFPLIFRRAGLEPLGLARPKFWWGHALGILAEHQPDALPVEDVDLSPADVASTRKLYTRMTTHEDPTRQAKPVAKAWNQSPAKDGAVIEYSIPRLRSCRRIVTQREFSQHDIKIVSGSGRINVKFALPGRADQVHGILRRVEKKVRAQLPERFQAADHTKGADYRLTFQPI